MWWKSIVIAVVLVGAGAAWYRSRAALLPEGILAAGQASSKGDQATDYQKTEGTTSNAAALHGRVEDRDRHTGRFAALSQRELRGHGNGRTESSSATTAEYQLDDGSGEIELGTGTATDILWLVQYAVLPGLTNIRRVSVAWGGTVPSGSSATVGVYSDPNGDGDPNDATVLRSQSVVTANEGTNIVNEYDTPDVVVGPPGTSFFLFAHRFTVEDEFPVRGDRNGGCAGPPCPVPGRNWIALSSVVSPPVGTMLIEDAGPGLACNWMVRADAGPPILCGDAICDPEEECICQDDCGPPPGGSEDDPSNGPLACQDGIDNDCDTLIDCDDSDCVVAFAESLGAGNCADGVDNDCDCDVDCADAGCAAAVNCLTCDLTPVTCPGPLENEPDCSNGYVDHFNGGCNSTPNVWSSIPAPAIGGAAVQRCGKSGRYLGRCESDDDCPADQVCNAGPGTCSGGACGIDCDDCLPSQSCAGGVCTAGLIPLRDTDWYQFTIPPDGDRQVTMCVTSEFQALIGILDDQGGPNCANVTFVTDGVGSGDFVACTQVCAPPVCLTEGTWTAFVAPSADTALVGVPCGSRYTMSLTAAACPQPNSVCNVEASNQCQLPNQEANGADGIVATVSDANPIVNSRVADNFTASTSDSISEVCWWGAYLNTAAVCAAAPCLSPPADDFTITYYNNNVGGSAPGTVKCGPFNVGDVESRLTGLVIPSGAGNLDEYSYTAAHASCAVAAGECVWIEIQNNTDPGQGCVWLWSTAPPGDGFSTQHVGSVPYIPGDERLCDLAWCLDTVVQPDGCEVIGACCDHCTATCTNDVSFADCRAEGGLFEQNTLCSALSVPCGLSPIPVPVPLVLHQGPHPVRPTSRHGGLRVGLGPPPIFPRPPGPCVDCVALGPCSPSGPFYDAWSSISGCSDPGTCQMFGVEGSPPIPAGFFGPGSQPFSGEICFRGIPLGMPQFGNADTLIERQSDPFEACALPSKVEVTVSIKIAALHLESIAPITVTYASGSPGQWDVEVDLSAVKPPPSTLTAIKTHCHGGTFTSVLHVLPRFTFRSVSEGEVSVLDTGIAGLSPITLMNNDPVPWVDDLGVLDAPVDPCSSFYPGFQACKTTTECDIEGCCGGTTCPNGLFCDGEEQCIEGQCVDQPDPCIDLAHCDEESDTCVSPRCLDDPTNNDPACWDTNSDNVRDERCVWWDCVAGACSSVKMVTLDAGGPFGSCPLDGFCNIHDAIHALRCFAGTNPCSRFAADLGGPFGSCANDGFCNIHDAIHALRCFAGTNACTCQSPAAPEFDPVVVAGAHLAASASKKAVRAGDEVQVCVHIEEPLVDLQAYQLHLGVSGGQGGQLELVDIAIEDRTDTVFGCDTDHYEAFNVAKAQMLNGLDASGVPTPGKGYLATFTYRASADAAGTFVVNVLHDEAAGHQTFLVADFTKKIEVTGTVPAAIVVEPRG